MSDDGTASAAATATALQDEPARERGASVAAAAVDGGPHAPGEGREREDVGAQERRGPRRRPAGAAPPERTSMGSRLSTKPSPSARNRPRPAGAGCGTAPCSTRPAAWTAARKNTKLESTPASASGSVPRRAASASGERERDRAARPAPAAGPGWRAATRATSVRAAGPGSAAAARRRGSRRGRRRSAAARASRTGRRRWRRPRAAAAAGRRVGVGHAAHAGRRRPRRRRAAEQQQDGRASSQARPRARGALQQARSSSRQRRRTRAISRSTKGPPARTSARHELEEDVLQGRVAAHLALRADLVQRALGDDAAAVDDRDLVAQALHHVEHVAR